MHFKTFITIFFASLLLIGCLPKEYRGQFSDQQKQTHVNIKKDSVTAQVKGASPIQAKGVYEDFYGVREAIQNGKGGIFIAPVLRNPLNEAMLFNPGVPKAPQYGLLNVGRPHPSLVDIYVVDVIEGTDYQNMLESGYQAKVLHIRGKKEPAQRMNQLKVHLLSEAKVHTFLPDFVGVAAWFIRPPKWRSGQERYGETKRLRRDLKK